MRRSGFPSQYREVSTQVYDTVDHGSGFPYGHTKARERSACGKQRQVLHSCCSIVLISHELCIQHTRRTLMLEHDSETTTQESQLERIICFTLQIISHLSESGATRPEWQTRACRGGEGPERRRTQARRERAKRRPRIRLAMS